jgi:hypothetical protein
VKRTESASVLVLLGIVVLTLPAAAADPVAVVTELRVGRGEVRVRLASEPDWKPPQPLLALRPGDQVRALGDSQVVLVFTGGRGTQVVTAANSPFTVTAPATEAASDRLRGLVGGVTDFLLGKQRVPAYSSLSVRSLRDRPLVLVSPRDTRVLPGAITFDWTGSDRRRYRLRVVGREGLLWEQGNLRPNPVAYPSTAPALAPGTRYRWEISTEGQAVQQAEFEVLPASDARRVGEALDLLGPARLAAYPGNTVVLMRAGLLFREGLYHDARQELVAAIARDRDEPSLHLLLGHIYERAGLQDLAAQAFDEAHYLATRAP